ncbi:MAG: M2 family metallopeptidase [Bacteroidales bacterium]|jgi:peptidyl-dipeptidase A|nr:M2 family metallopeptidase [Bacteroidales bacterium]
MNRIKFISVFIIACIFAFSCTTKQEKMEKKLSAFIASYEEKAIPLSIQTALTDWNANITGTDADLKLSEKASFEEEKFYTGKEAFTELKEIKESGAVKDPILARQLELIYSLYLGGQVDTALIAERLRMETEINKKYLNFRAVVNGKDLGDNQIEDILRNSTSSADLQTAWEAHKQIGPLVADDIIKLVEQRNLIAKTLGFNNFHEMTLKLSGQDPAEVTAIFEELDNLTRDAFAQLKGEIDAYYAGRYKINAADLRPWHYQNRYFQEAPEIYPVDFDKYYENQDPAKLAATFFDGIGLNVDAILAKSDLYEKPGKNQHAFSTDIDRAGDVRTLDNISPDSYWMNTILHELGHGVYSYYNDMTLPFTLRDAAHTFTTEAIANLFGRMATDPLWMQKMGIIDEAEAKKISENSTRALRLQMLVFSRWAQVMYNFEKSMYGDPQQDLNKLWWDMVEKYQMLKNPEGRNMPDWATKIHVALYPCYYHNYLLGEVLASQLYSYITTNITENKSFVGEKSIGEYLKGNVFMPGARYSWNDMIEKATGEKLTAKYYAKQFVE